jgi:starch synthase
MREALVGDESGYQAGHRVVFRSPRTVDYRASISDIADYLLELMQDAELRKRMGGAGRKRAIENYNYLTVAKRFLTIVSDKLGIR